MNLKLIACSLMVVFCVALSVGCDGGGSPGGGASTDGGAGDAVKAYQRTHARIAAALGGGATPTADETANIITADRPATLDPHDTENGGDVKIINQIYQTLIRIDPADPDTLIAELAESWMIADDGLSITFTIRPGVTFHDGATLDAQAAKLSLDRLCGRYLDVPAAPYRSFYDFVGGVEADGMTLTVKLTRPVARIALRNLSMFSASIVSPKLLEATKGMSTGERSSYIADWASGTGPYYLFHFDPASATTSLHAFDGYWGGKPKVRALLFRQIGDPAARVEQLRSAAVDMVDDVPRPVWDEFDANKDIRLHKWWALNICYLAINVDHEKTRDPDVRRAIQLAVAPEQMVDLYYGTARPTYSLVGQTLGEYDPKYRAAQTNLYLGVRRDMARKLLARSSGKGVAFKLYHPADDRPYMPQPAKIADKIRQQLTVIGMDVTPVAVPNAEYFKSAKEGKYELAMTGWMSDNADADNFYGPLADGDGKSPSSTNYSRVMDAQVHEMLVKAQSLTDRDARVAAYRTVERRLQDDLIAYVPLVNTQQGMAFVQRLTGVEVDALGYYRFHSASLAGK